MKNKNGILIAMLFFVSALSEIHLSGEDKLEIAEYTFQLPNFGKLDFSGKSETNLNFFENKGQIKFLGHDVRYLVKTKGISLYVKPDGLLYSFSKISQNEKVDIPGHDDQELDLEVSSLFLTWEGSNPAVKIKALDQIKEVRNYYEIGKNVDVTNVRGFNKIIYEELYENIDMVLYSNGNELKYDFIIKPGGDVKDIKLAYSGHNGISINAEEELNLEGSFGSFKEGRPFTYQEIDGVKAEVRSNYFIKDGKVGFEVGEFDRGKPLVIDPSLIWATYYGGENDEEGNAVATDHLGNVYVAGKTVSINNIASLDGHDRHLGGEWDAFLVKYDPTGNRLWATYYGGNRRDIAHAVCTDPSGNVYLAGYTDSNTDIAFNGHDNVYNEFSDPEGTRFDRDAFLVKFNTNGIRIWGTYYGGEDFDSYIPRAETAFGVCSDGDGNIYLTGFTSSETGIAHNGHQNNYAGNEDAFLVKFNTYGARQWGTYFGSAALDRANAICTDPWGNIYITGKTEGTNMAHFGHDMFYSGNTDAFLTKFSQDGILMWSTYYGGSDYDEGFSVATDGSGNVYLAGVTKSIGEISHNAFDATFNGDSDAFLVKFNFLGNRLWGTYYGGNGSELNSAVTVSKNGDIYLAGSTSSQSGIATNNGYDKTFNNGGHDGYLVRFNDAGQRQWGTYYGGSGNDFLQAVTTDVSANVYVAGKSNGDNGISLNGYQNARNGSYDAVLAKFNPYQTGSFPQRPGDLKIPSRPDFNRPDSFNDLKGTPAQTVGQQSFQLKVFPSPATNFVQVNLENLGETAHNLVVFDLQSGKLVYKRDGVGSINESINVIGWKKGFYSLKIQTGGVELTEKFMVR